MTPRRTALADALGLAVILLILLDYFRPSLLLLPTIAAGGDLLALRELAMHHEHRSRDLPASLEAVERALGLLSSAAPGRAMADFARRHERLLQKLARAAPGERRRGSRRESPKAGP